ncbi:MAG: hypothetical protein V5804_16860 [Mucilaginibacter sp.]|uniref:hypothetical protein n=1 Tax=Mucilaginibacter sp. TaxID=1882438 RepID=UPI0034E4CB4C
MNKLFTLVLLLILGIKANAQNTDSLKLKVFIDCRTGCDLDFIKTEIPIVDFVLDRLAADAHVLVTTQPVGSGGTQYQLNIYGQHRYKNTSDTLTFATTANATASETRQKLLQYLMFGLSPLIAKTLYSKTVKITMKDEASANTVVAESVKKDKWNLWVYNVSASGSVSAEQIYKNNVLSSNFSADRITNKLKVHFNLNGNLHNSIFDYDTVKYTVKNTDYNFYHYLSKSFSPHWSFGYQTSFSNNTFNNIKRSLYFGPAIEFNVFKYKDVNDRFFVLRYGPDVTNNHYYDTTIYNKQKETIYGHRFSAALILNKKWGTFTSGIYYRNYFLGGKLNSKGINARADVKVTGSLSFFVYIDANIIHDQINLVKSGATEQEVLTRQRQLASNYNYNTSFGLNFRFGSILNNFVNPSFQSYHGF